MTPLTKLVNRDQFGPWLMANGLSKLGVEVGTFRGEYAHKLLSNWGGALVTIDPYDWDKNPAYVDGCVKDWERSQAPLDPEAVYADAQKRLEQFGPLCEIWRKPSLDAVHMFADCELDFVYLDGNHSFESVSAELPIWWRKVRRGGVLCGHDFYNRDDEHQQCGVASAVMKFCQFKFSFPHITHCSSWWLQKK